MHYGDLAEENKAPRFITKTMQHIQTSWQKHIVLQSVLQSTEWQQVHHQTIATERAEKQESPSQSLKMGFLLSKKFHTILEAQTELHDHLLWFSAFKETLEPTVPSITTTPLAVVAMKCTLMERNFKVLPEVTPFPQQFD